MDRAKKDFDFSCEISSPHYFKSSFAKSMAVESKSLDYACVSQLTNKNHLTDIQINGNPTDQLIPPDKCHTVDSHTSLNSSNHTNTYQFTKSTPRTSFRRENNKLWNLKCEPSNRAKNVESDSDVIRLRKECQILLEENRWLRGSEGAVLQSQVDTLHWQLQQTESSRQMYRQVLEQVAKFLDRTHVTLDALETRPAPRARSVYSVDVGETGRAMPRTQSTTHMNSRPLSRTMSHIQMEKPSFKATTADGLPNYSAFSDFTWRRDKKTQASNNQTSEKLAKEAFRLLRTVQSLLSTREPELAHKHPGSIIEENNDDVEHHFQLLDIQRDGYKSMDMSANNSKSDSMVYTSGSLLPQDLETEFHCIDHETTEPLPPPVCSVSTVSSTEDESGFSSMSSFQEVGLPLPPPPSNHRRWGSSPVDAHAQSHAQYYLHNDRLQVLWV